MVQRAGGPRFLLEAAQAVRIIRDLRGQHFDRDVPVQSRIAGAIDLAHAPGSEECDYLMRAESVSWNYAHPAVSLFWPHQIVEGQVRHEPDAHRQRRFIREEQR